MALTPTIVSARNADNILGKTKKIVKGTFAFDNLYPTNGYTIPIGSIGLKTIDSIFIGSVLGYIPTYVSSTGKILVRGGAGAGNALVEAAANTDLSTLNAVPFEAEGSEQV